MLHLIKYNLLDSVPQTGWMCADYIADGTFSGFVAGQNGLKDALGDSVGSH